MTEYPPFDWQSLRPAPVIGVDEVGRGCLAGPVCAAAAILDTSKDISAFTDSKKISAKRREKLSAIIHEEHKVAIAFASIEEISKYNILHASLLAMKRAVEALGVTEGHIVVDGNQRIPNLSESFLQTTLVKGDFRAAPVAAASIAAKVCRDNLMIKAAEEYPDYMFEKHKGYSTALHKSQIEKVGPCPLHRPTFAGVKEFL